MIIGEEPLLCLLSEALIFTRVVVSRILYALNGIFKYSEHERFFSMGIAGIDRGAVKLLRENSSGGQQSAGAGEIIEE